jgi:hypothetical protein
MITKRHHSHPIVCNGPCGNRDQLGTVDLPDSASPDDIAQALSPYLGEDCDCGPTYREAVSRGDLSPGARPTADHITAYRARREEARQAAAQLLGDQRGKGASA